MLRMPSQMFYYDRTGQPLADITAWDKLHDDIQYRRVAETTVPDGTWISTVWLGIDHRFSEGPPLIFETMVFPQKGGTLDERDQVRYSTEVEALAGHEAMVVKWGGPVQGE